MLLYFQPPLRGLCNKLNEIRGWRAKRAACGYRKLHPHYLRAVKFRELTGDTAPETDSSSTIRERVIRARERQQQRLGEEKIFSNAAKTPRMIRRYCRIDAESEQMLERAMTRLGLSARAYDRILKVSRTIADLEASAEIRSAHVAEAVGYRLLDRTYWT